MEDEITCMIENSLDWHFREKQVWLAYWIASIPWFHYGV